MVYTMSRLEHALLVFRESEPYLARRNHHTTYLEALLTQPREHNTRNRRGKPLTKKPELWEESDESEDGEYDPSKQRKKKKGGETKVKRVKKGKEGGGNDVSGSRETEKKEKKGTTLARGRMEGKMLEITLHFPSEEGRALLKELAEKFGTGTDDDDAAETPEHDAGPSAAKPAKTFAMTGMRLNATMTPTQLLEQRRRFEAQYSDEPMPDEGDCVPSGTRSLRNRVVATEPVPNTQSCGPCKRGKRPCARNVGQSGECKSCEKLNRRCWVLETVDEKEKQTNQQGDKEPEKQKATDEEAVEKVTKRSFLGAHLENEKFNKDTQQNNRTPVTKADAGSRNDAMVVNSPPPSTQASTPRPQVSAQKQGFQGTGCIKVITTNWAHPINFMHQNFTVNGKPRIPCHFCIDFRYGIIGCGKIKVEVIQYGNSLEYHETGDGNVEKGFEPTRMCIVCALNRLHISSCAHKMGRWKTPDPGKLDYQAWMTQLLMRSPKREDKPRHPCCSLCQSPATFGCSAGVNKLNVKGLFSRHILSERKCCLWLCDGCEGAVEKIGWRRWALQTDILQKGVAPRADMEFLFPGSDLHKSWGVVPADSSTTVRDRERTTAFK